MIKNLLKLFAFFVIFAALGAGGAYLFFEGTDFGKTAGTPPPERKDITESTGPLTGKGLFLTPSFEEQLLDEAKLTLANLDMKPGRVVWVHSDAAEKGRIIAQRPPAGSSESGEINFLVSLGPYEVEYKCPSFVDMTPDDARMLAEELGIKLTEVDEGMKIMSQKPEAGALIKKGDTVEVTLGSRLKWF